MGEKRFRKQIDGQNAFRQLNFKAFRESIGTLEQVSDLIVIAGDVFDYHDPDVESVLVARETLENCEVPVYIIGGNHDWSKNQESRGFHCFDMLKSQDEQLSGSEVSGGPVWLTEPYHLTPEAGLGISFLPFGYLKPEWFNEVRKWSFGDELKVLVCHGYVSPFNDDGLDDVYRLPQEVTNRFDLTVCGHVHLPMNSGSAKCRVLTPGSLMPSNQAIGVTGDVRPSVWVYDTSTRSAARAYLKTPPAVHEVFTDDLNGTLEQVNDHGIWVIHHTDSVTQLNEYTYKKAKANALNLQLHGVETTENVINTEQLKIPPFWEWCANEHPNWVDEFKQILASK